MDREEMERRYEELSAKDNAHELSEEELIEIGDLYRKLSGLSEKTSAKADKPLINVVHLPVD